MMSLDLRNGVCVGPLSDALLGAETQGRTFEQIDEMVKDRSPSISNSS